MDSFDHDVFRGLKVDRAKADRLWRSNEPNSKQRLVCERLKMPYLLWSSFMSCWFCYREMERNVDIMRHDPELRDLSVFKMFSAYKVNVALHRDVLSAYEDMHLNELEKIFVLNHKKVIPALRKQIGESAGENGFQDNVDNMLVHLWPFLEMPDTNPPSYNEMAAQMARQLTARRRLW